jgi:ribosome-interacting GTPase 1
VKRRKAYNRIRETGIPNKLQKDRGFRRMHWVRYADDILVILNGPRADAEQLQRELGSYLEGIGLRLSEKKTLITRATRG